MEKIDCFKFTMSMLEPVLATVSLVKKTCFITFGNLTMHMFISNDFFLVLCFSLRKNKPIVAAVF